MRIFIAAFGLGILASASMADNAQIGWSDLVDTQAQMFEDPYRELDEDQFDQLMTVVRLRDALEDGALGPERRTEIETGLAAAETSLAGAGIDADWLISQRWIVAERREAAANAGNPALDDQSVSISGFAIAAPRDEDGASVIYLVEAPGMCSHMPPPSPNQMVRVRLASDWTPDFMHQPVSLTGRLHIDPSDRMFRVVDGDVPMKATWRLEAVSLAPLTQSPGGMGGSADWIEQLRVKLASSKTAKD
ncbi:DUF3299 domain-containing protein [Tropicimonas sediminicola]|uniref:DUF3299 domain-containing protein n=1 Tax=Tropicimonas sediminicola TaxID=1031541 RepID=A0A239FRR9_9RHOB|nr:DUF3299 domain-containing protein [Tropicimonas sediminicola]SNS59746.1 hypothetical protein SAMN05421757_102813 [Tropicimonas sediminicola]